MVMLWAVVVGAVMLAGCWQLTSPARDLCTGLLGWHQQLLASVLRNVGVAAVAGMCSQVVTSVL